LSAFWGAFPDTFRLAGHSEVARTSLAVRIAYVLFFVSFGGAIGGFLQ
jgi:hypothetical protein